MNDLPKLTALAAAVLISLVSVTYAATLTINANLINTGNFSITGSISKGAGTFVIDHPLDPANKLLYHSFVESPDVKNVYAGNTTLDDNGETVIQLPDYFEALNKDFRYQLFAVGRPNPDLYIKKRLEHNGFTIGGGIPGSEVSWMVTGIRHDPYILKHPIVPEVEKGPNALVEKGECIYPPLCK